MADPTNAPVTLPPDAPISTPETAQAGPVSPIALPQDAVISTPATEPPPSQPAEKQTGGRGGPIALASAPYTDNDHGVLSFLKDQTESAGQALGGMLFGKGTTGGQFLSSEQYKDANPFYQKPGETRSYWQRQKDDFGKILNTSAIVLGNAIPDEQLAANQHPHVTAAIKGTSDAIQGLTSPASIAMIIGTEGIGELPTAVEKAFAGSETLAPYAANAAKVAARGLQALGVYFTGDQIAQVMSAVPEVAKAVLSGQTDKAIELTTQALINGAVAYHAGKGTAKGIREYNAQQAASSAMANKDYSNLVHERAAQLVTAGGQKDQVADLGLKAAPKLADREWTSEYVEANRDRAELAKRQAETKAGPTPAAQIGTQGGGILPIEPKEPLNTEDYYFHAVDKSRLPSIQEKGLEYPWLAKSPDDAMRSGVAPISGNRSDLAILAVPRDEVTPVEPDKADIGAREVEKGKYVKSGDTHTNFIQVDQKGVPINGSPTANYSGKASDFVDKDYLDPDSGDEMYHVTTANDKVQAEGLKSRKETGNVGLGGGYNNQAPGKVSVTFDEGHANQIAETMRLAAEAARDEITPSKALGQFLSNHGEYDDMTPRDAAEALGAPKEIAESEDWEDFDKWFDETYKQGDAYEVIQKLDDHLSDLHADSEHPSGRVGLTSSKEDMAKVDPKQIAILKVEGRKGAKAAHVPDEMELRFNPQDLRIVKRSAPQNELGATHVYNPDTKAIEPLTTGESAAPAQSAQQKIEAAGGIYRGKNNGGLVEITLPRSMTDKLSIDDRMKNFVSVTMPENSVTPESVKAAMDKKFIEMGGKPEAAPAPQAGAAQGAKSKNIYTPSAQEALALQAAVKDAQAAAAKHVVTPEERAKMTTQQDPNRQITPEHEKAVSFVMDKVRKLGQEAQKRGLLKDNQVRDTFVPHEFDFDQTSDPLRRRLFDTYHEAQQAGHVPKNKDYFALTSDYVGKMWNRIADADTIRKLYAGRTNDGSPLAVSGGFVEGQRVSGEGPQSRVLNDAEIKKYAKNGQLPELIRSGRVEYNPDAKTYTMKADDYVKADNLYEMRPIGPTPIPPHILEDMQTSGTLDKLVEKGLIFRNKDGDYVSTQPLWARTPVYLHPSIAEHFNNVVKPTTSEPTSFFGRMGKLYDDTTGNMKSLLLSWSPFHRVTESARMMESMGIVKGGKLAGQTNLKMAEPIDYFNLTPSQASAVRDGIVTADPRGKSMSNVEEGLGAGEGNNWGNKTYKLFDTMLEKLHVPEGIRNKLNLQNILTKDVFGPQGMITQAKFKMYDTYKPQISDQMRADHPDWSPAELDKQAGRLAAEFANNKFGGLNQVLLGRTLKDQKLLRRLLLAPDFLESTGRSILDVANPYGTSLAAKLIQFNIAHALTAAGINYALHHDPNDRTMNGRVNATHLLDHPFEVIGPDGKTAYGFRATMTDFLHMMNRPREFAYDRLNPLVRAGEEIGTERNAYGRKEPLGEALLSVPKATLPIQIQNAVGLGTSATAEPSVGQQFMKSVGIQARPNRTPAEQKAIDLMSSKLEGTEALTGGDLVRQQLKFNAEDKLRAALQAKNEDPNKEKAAEDAKHDIDVLTARKIITPQERKNILTDARGSRLKSSFIHMDPKDALDVWDLASDQEKEELGAAMQAHFIRWKERLAQQGEHIGALNDPFQKVYDRFKTASQQLSQIHKADQAQRDAEEAKNQPILLPANAEIK